VHDYVEARTMGLLWNELLREIMLYGEDVGPRGLGTVELRDVKLILQNPRANLIAHERRRVGYKYAVAEWLWIWFGGEDVKTIAQYNPKIVQYSDDGQVFHGAYGPRMIPQLLLVMDKLEADPESRQAVVNIYDGRRDLGRPTLDVPCTISMQFLRRRGKLHTIVNMRSSDAFVGLLYDIFMFTQIAETVRSHFNDEQGTFSMNLGSSHIYETQLEEARAVLDYGQPHTIFSPALPGPPPGWMLHALVHPGTCQEYKATPDGQVNPEPWARYLKVLAAENNSQALEILKA
jgi:thymidylate synthase